MADEGKDIGARLASQVAKADAEIEGIAGGFERSARAASDLSSILEQIILQNKDLPKGIVDADGLMKKMAGNAKTFAKYEKEILSIQEKGVNKALQRALELRDRAMVRTKGQFAQTKLYFEVEKKIAKLQEDAGNNLKLRIALEKKRQEQQAKEEKKVAKGTSFMESATDGLKSGGTDLLFKAVTAPFQLIKSAFMETWDFLDKKVIPTNAKINKQFGNMGEELRGIKSQAVSAGVQFELLGLPFEQGAQATTDFFGAMSYLPKSTKEAREMGKEALKMSEYVGLGGEAAGKLALAFQKSDGTLGGLKKTMEEASTVAHKYHVPVNQIRKDFGENLDILARYGTKNRMVFLESAAKARSYGLTIKDLDSTFGKALDTIEGTSKVSADLNSIFGTNINNLDLLLAGTETERLEILRKELTKTGKTWDLMSKFEKNALTSTLQITEEKANLAFASEDVRRKLEKEAKAQEKSAKVQKDWNKALGSLKSTLLPLTALIDNFLRSFANWFSKMLGFDNSTKVVKSAAKTIETFFGNITTYFSEKKVGGIEGIKKSFDGIVETLSSKDFAENIGKFIEAVPTTIAKITPFFVDRLPQLLDMTSKVIKRAAWLFGVDDPAEEKAEHEAKIKQIEGNYREKGMFGTNSQLENDRNVVRGAKTGEANLTQAILLQNRLNASGDQAMVQEKTLSALEDLGDLTRFLKSKGMLEKNGQINDRARFSIGLGPNVHDALITKRGEVVKFDNQDNIFATKNPMTKESVKGQGSSSNKGWELIKVEVAPIYLDGKKISEAQVRVSRY